MAKSRLMYDWLHSLDVMFMHVVKSGMRDSQYIYTDYSGLYLTAAVRVKAGGFYFHPPSCYEKSPSQTPKPLLSINVAFWTEQ